MYLTKSKHSPFYQLIYFRNGKRTSVSTKCRLKSEAWKFYKEFTTPNNADDKNATPLLSEFEEIYLNDSSKTKSDNYLRAIQLSFRMLQRHLGNIAIDKINYREVNNFISSVYERSKSAAGLYHRTLKAAFSKAVLWDYIEENPFKKLKSPKQVTSLPVFITPEEFYTILNFVKHTFLKDLYITAFFTGMRLSELTNMKWTWVDLNNNLITVKNTDGFTSKSKRERIIPIHPKVNEIFRQRKSKSAEIDMVYYRYARIKLNGDFVSRQFKNSVRLSGLSDKIHFHTLRHSFASNLVQKGVSLYIVKELLGHSSITTTQKYSHLNNGSLLNAVNLL